MKDGAGNTDSRNLRFVTGGESGTYYAFGSVIAQHATNNAGVNVVGLVGNGSQANVQELADGTADFAFCQSDVMAYAYNGTNLFKSKVEGFSTVAALYMEQVQIVTTNPATSPWLTWPARACPWVRPAPACTSTLWTS